MNVKEVLKKNKVAVVGVAVLLVAGVAIGGKVYADNQKAKEQARIEQKQKEEKSKAIKLGEDINSLFHVGIFENGDLEEKMVKDAVVKYDLKNDAVKTIKEQYYQEKPKNKTQELINELLVNAENQVKQFDTAKKAVEKVFKDNKVVNTDQKNYESAVKEVDKIKNAKEKEELSTKLKKVKQEIDKKNKEQESKKKETEKVAKESNEKANENSVVDEVVGNIHQQQVQEDAQQQVYQEPVQEQGNNGWSGQSLPQAPAQQSAPSASGGGQSPTEQPATPPTSGGGQSEWVPDMGWGEQTGNIDGNGGTWTGGWEEVK